MPKVRDLGISFIPATMRPLEIGDGAGRDYDCDPSGCSEGPSACIEPSYGDCEPRSTCLEPTYRDPCDPSGCSEGPSTCIEPSHGGKKDKDKDEQNLSAASIAQLKQQLQHQLGA